ncbi:MAG: glycosyltransferase [Acidobacteriota bacterium]
MGGGDLTAGAREMSPPISFVLVTFNSSGVAGEAVETFRAQAAAAGLAAEVVVVDHSGAAAEVERLQASRPDRLLIQANRGYAAGINAGVAASRGDFILAGNPDIAFQPRALAALLDALADGWGIAGPQFVLGDWLLPTADRQTPGAELARALAARSQAAWRHHLLAEQRRWRTAWEASAPAPCANLTGALLAFRRQTWERVGEWDDGYFLYFEETDWLARARRLGITQAFVPNARIKHSWAHSADPVKHASHFAASRRRFYARHHGALGRLALWAGDRPAPQRVHAPLPADLRLDAGRILWLISPSPSGHPAAGLFGGSEAPTRALRQIAQERGATGAYTLAAVTAERATLLGIWRWAAEPCAGSRFVAP